MQGDRPLTWHHAHAVGIVLALLVALAPVGAATTPAGDTTAGTGGPAAIGGATAAALTGFPTAPLVNNSDTSHDPTTTTSLSVAYNATGQVGSASDVAVELYNASDGSFVTANTTLGATEGFATLSVPAGTFSGDQPVTYKLNDTSSGTILATDGSMLLASGGSGTAQITIDSVSLSKTTVDQNEDLDVTATVSNAGASEGWMLVPLYHDGSVAQVTNVTVPAGGQKQVTITTTFATAGSHTVAVGGQSTKSVAVQTRGSPSVVDSSVRVVGGTQPTGDVIVGTTVSNGKLDVRLKARGVQNGETDLANIGADTTTRFEVEVGLKDFTPRMMMGTGGNVSWSVGPGSTADTANLTLYIEPRENQRFYYQDGSQPTYGNWPTENEQATTMREAQALVSFYNMANAPVRFRTTLTGGTIVTDAQSFSPPMYKQGSSTQKPRLTVQVAGPHFTVDGSQNEGYYEALIPDGILEQWGVTSAGQLRAAYGGSQTQATFTETSTGIKMKLDTHYSAETAEIKPGGSDTTVPTADAGSDATVTAGSSVTLDASATVENVGTAAGSHTVELRRDGETVATRVVDLGAGETTPVTFTVAPDAAGTYAFRVDDASAGQITVEEPAATATPAPTATGTAAATTAATPTSDASAPGFGAVVALLALLAAGLLADRRD